MLDVIQKRLKIIGDIEEELNRIKGVYEESLEDDPVYQEVQEAITKAKDETKEKKSKVLAKSNYIAFEEELKQLRQDLKENKEILSQELLDYYRENGTLEIVDDEGNQKRMKFSVKLINS